MAWCHKEIYMPNNITIVFNKEILVDLNAYYSQFSRSLKNAINDELYGILGGSPPKRTRGPSKDKNGATVEIGKKMPKMGSKLRVTYDAIKRTIGDNALPYEEFRKKVLELTKGEPRTFGNLITGKYLIVSK
jgi:hypothetical protein